MGSIDPSSAALFGIVLGVLAAATITGQILKRQPDSGLNPAAVSAFNGRLRAWWMICCLLATAFWFPYWVTVLLFGLVSFWALREFITLTPTRLGDHRALFWVFFIFTPLQYVLVGLDQRGSNSTYGIYSILIPVYALLFIPARVAITGDYERFLERVAKIQAGLLVCVYCLSFAPAILYLPIPDYNNPKLLFYFVVIVQLFEAFQYLLGRLYGQHVIAPLISSSRTWEGFLGGAGTAALVGMAISFATPFNPWQSAAMSLLISLMAFGGGMTMSAIKRDRGVKDYGTLVEGHGGVLDRIDSICFAAPVFFHVTRYFFAAGGSA
jgi:phosphatidate cytidylyltransferase